MLDHRSHRLVSSSDVNGTEVYSRNGDHIGTIDHLMIDKQSGRVGYAVMTFGGFLGLGEDAYHVPWSALSYDTGLNGFVTDITREQVEGAPERPDDWDRDRTWEERVYSHYGFPYYWV